MTLTSCALVNRAGSMKPRFFVASNCLPLEVFITTYQDESDESYGLFEFDTIVAGLGYLSGSWIALA